MPRSKFVRATRWVAPSVVAACAGAVAEGLYEGIPLDRDALGLAAGVGFVGIVMVPLLAVLALMLRGAWAAWRPRGLADALREDGGGMPRLFAWLVVAWLALLWIAWSMFQGTWLLANTTAFKPLSVSFGLPVIVAGAGLLAALWSRPVALGLAAIVRRVDRRWLRGGVARRSLVTPWKIVGGLGVMTAGLGVGSWLFARGRLGPIDLSLAYGPAIAAIAAIAVHATWRAIGRGARVIGGVLMVGALAVGAIAATTSASREPSLALEIWGDQPIAGVAIELVFDLDAIRSGISLTQFKPTLKPDVVTHPDLVLITIDTVRADHTPPYGGKAEMPGLRALGERGAVFEWAFAPGNVTRRSIPSIAIGLQPNRIRGRVVGWALRVDPRHVMLAERLAAAGYDTAGFMCCDGFYGDEARTGLQRGLQHLEIEKNGLALAKRARTWLAQRGDGKGRPLFVWMHILEPHGWTQVTGEPHTDEERTQYYNRSLAAADAALAELMAGFADRGPDKQPIYVVTADHGEGLGDHGQPYHSTDLYDAQIRVPLVIAGPGVKPGRVIETVSLVDLVPTIIDLAGYVPPSGASIDGRSIADLVTGARVGNAAAGTAFSAMIKDRSNPGGLTAVVRGPYKLIENEGGGYELFNVHADPDEKFNLISHLPSVVNELKALLFERQRRAKQPPFL